MRDRMRRAGLSDEEAMRDRMRRAGLSDDEAQSLQRNGIARVDDLLAEVTGMAGLRRDELGVKTQAAAGNQALDPRATPPQRSARGPSVKATIAQRIGDNYAPQLDQIAKQTGVSRDRLSWALTELGLSEADQERGWWPRRHWLDVAVMLLIAAAVWVSWRAWNPLGETVLVAGRDLKANTVLKATDLAPARLRPGDDYFADEKELQNLILARSIPRGKPLQFKDVLQLQVVAAQDMPAGAVIASDAISLTWTAYEAGAALISESVAGRKALRALRKGDPVLVADVEPAAAPVPQVVVAADGGLEPLQIVGPNDVRMEEAPRADDSFTSTTDVVGRYALAAAPKGEVLRSGQVSQSQLARADMDGRELVSLPFGIAAVSRTVAPGTNVSLLFAPRDRRCETPDACTVSNLVVWAVERRDFAASIVVAVGLAERDKLRGLLANSDVFVLQPAP